MNIFTKKLISGTDTWYLIPDTSYLLHNKPTQAALTSIWTNTNSCFFSLLHRFSFLLPPSPYRQWWSLAKNSSSLTVGGVIRCPTPNGTCHNTVTITCKRHPAWENLSSAGRARWGRKKNVYKPILIHMGGCPPGFLKLHYLLSKYYIF